MGLIAQLVDGSLGMAYGVTSSTLLLTVGITPAAASAAVHFSEIGTTIASGFSHHKLGNVDWRTVRIIAIPGGIGAFVGATSCPTSTATSPSRGSPFLLLGLGLYVMWRFLVLGGRRPVFKGKESGFFLAPLGLVAGTMDAIGGGGWGPVGTTTLLSTGRLEPRKVVGSIDASEFIVALGGSVGFLLALGSQGINFGIRRGAPRRRRDRRAVRRLARAPHGAAGPGRRGRRPDRRDQRPHDPDRERASRTSRSSSPWAACSRCGSSSSP